MKIYTDLMPGLGFGLWVLCRKPGSPRRYTWINEKRQQGAYDLPQDDALVLAKLLKLDVKFIEFERIHVVRVGPLDKVNNEGIRIEPRLTGIVGVGVCNAGDKIDGAIGGGELFALNGFAHGDSIKKDPIVAEAA